MKNHIGQLKKIFIAAFFAILLSALNISAATFIVTNTNDSGAGSLRQAITDANAATTADTIVFDASFNTARTITLASSLPLITGSATNTLTITGPGANLLTVSGNNAVRIFNINGLTVVSISGLTISQASSGDFGGGIRSLAASLTLTNLVVAGNATTSGGGGIYHAGEDISISGCTISNNAASSFGGGVHFDSTAVRATISNSTISGNQANGVISSGGGITLNRGGQLTISNSVISGNSAAFEGGGLYSSGSTPTAFLNITDTTVSNNTVNPNNTVNYGYGGGLYIEPSGGTGTTITNSTISGNRAVLSSVAGSSGGEGGGIYANSSLAVRLINSTVSGNTAGNSGGGIYDNNDGSSGGSPVNITGSTIVLNTASASGFGAGGGGIFVVAGTQTNSLRNSIVANNTSGGTGQDISGTITSEGYNLIRNTTGATVTGTTTGNITGVDPMLDILDDNGGPTRTHSLMPGSPAIDAGDPANFSAADQRGMMRPIDGDGNGSALPDIGSFEVAAPTAADATLSGSVTENGRGIFRAVVKLTDAQGIVRTALTNPFGYFSFQNVQVGQTYIVSVSSKRYIFAPQIISPNEDVTNLNFSPIASTDERKEAIRSSRKNQKGEIFVEQRVSNF